MGIHPCQFADWGVEKTRGEICCGFRQPKQSSLGHSSVFFLNNFSVVGL